MYEFYYRFIPILIALVINIGLHFVNTKSFIRWAIITNILIISISYTILLYIEHKEMIFWFDTYDHNDLMYASKLLANEYFYHIIGLVAFLISYTSLLYKKRFILIQKIE